MALVLELTYFLTMNGNQVAGDCCQWCCCLHQCSQRSHNQKTDIVSNASDRFSPILRCLRFLIPLRTRKAERDKCTEVLWLSSQKRQPHSFCCEAYLNQMSFANFCDCWKVRLLVMKKTF